jgi:O-antigen ligase
VGYLTPEQGVAARIGTGAVLLLPAGLTVYFSFNAGGFFPGSVAFATVLLAAALALRIALAESPFEGFTLPVTIAAGALGLFGLWSLLSGRWGLHAPGRALVEFDRALLYLLVLVLFGSLRRTAWRLRWMLRGLALGIVAVCVTGLATRVLPDAFPIAETIADDRLSYPVTYWNALGVLASVGTIICFHFASSRSEPPAVRVLGAGAIPLLVTTLYFTFSRGAIAAGIVGLVAYVAIGRPRALPSGLLATVPAAVIAVLVAYDADLLASLDPTTSAAADQGRTVALVVVACALAAGLLRLALLALDSRLPRLHLWQPASARSRAIAAGAVAAVAIVLLLALDVPGGIGDQYDKFVHNSSSGTSGADLRTRLSNPTNNGRIDEWDVALDAFSEKRLGGYGAGTYQNLWAVDRPITLSVRDAHSLYVEALAEVGVVGSLLLIASLATILIALALRSRGPHRTLYAVLLAVTLTWALHAGLDWDWEMPAVTLWVFALGGAALAASREDRPARPPSGIVRIGAVLACFCVAVVPGLILTSQTRLDDGADDFARGDCRTAVSDSTKAINVLRVRPEPYEIRGFCRLQNGSPHQAVKDFERALDLDPGNWIYHYDLALALAVAGDSPAGQAILAVAYNPMSVEARRLAKRLATRDRHRWRPEAERLLRGASPFYLSGRGL